MSDPELKLNALARYSKRSPHLVLEEYSHCEVPAGCGGVVLRWRNPDEPIPMVVRSFADNGRWEYQGLDGTDTLFDAKLLITYGTHAFTLIVRDIDPKFAVALLVGKLDEQYARILRPQGDTTILSVPDGTWRYTLEPPQGDAWQQPDFDDQAWLPLVRKRIIARSKYRREWTKELTDQGAQGLGVDTKAALVRQMRKAVGAGAPLPAIYIRKTFTLTKNQQE
jgi:hypothetical protein